MGLALKGLKQLETKISETIFAYRPPSNANKQLWKYLADGHINISTLTQTNSRNTTNHLTNFCDIFALSNLVNAKTCTKSVCGTSLDTMLTNNLEVSIILASAVTTRLSDCHKLILSYLRAHLKGCLPKR